MTLPSSGIISISDINTEVGAASNTARGLDWLGSNVKGFTAYNIATVYGLTWLARNNVAANCTLNMAGQCNCVVNCGATQGNPSNFDGVGGLTNCTANSACNCNCNCDSRAWLQANCNCAAANGYNNCAYNCNYTNCNCNCNCNCQCRC